MTEQEAVEVNFDGLVGPTHNYAGLSLGNQASQQNAGGTSSPRTAALQGLAKMRRLHSLGVAQAVLPPPLRPDPSVLRSLGFDPARGLTEVAAVAPQLIPTLMSASSMWAANAATVSPSADTADGKLHLTPANLVSTVHRALEPNATHHILRSIFASEERFQVHRPLPSAAAFADEGAANHGRVTNSHGEPGIHVFVYGREAHEVVTDGYPRRQSRLAGELIAGSHGLDPRRVRHVRQSPTAIDAGAFHNDVVSVINERVLFTHESAFADPEAAADLDARVVVVKETEVPLRDAISSYLFNSQLVTLPDGTMTLVAPIETEETNSTRNYLAAAIVDPANPIDSVETMDLRESMRNGGGPACLRLRVVMTGAERSALRGRVMMDDGMLDRLETWVDTHYRSELRAEDLNDPALIIEVADALRDLEQLLDLPGLYNLADLGF